MTLSRIFRYLYVLLSSEVISQLLNIPTPSRVMAFIQPKLAPALNLPASSSIVSVHAINTTLDMVCKTSPFLAPVIPGHELVNFPAFAFLIENKALGKRVLFDVGGRKDYWNYAPRTAALLRLAAKGMKIEKTVDELIVGAGINLESIDYLIWRLVQHAYLINICSVFPKLIVRQPLAFRPYRRQF
jgi:hypothetical protein